MIFFVARSGQEIGEFDETQFREHQRTGFIQPTDHFWCEGMTDWQQVGRNYTPPPLPTKAEARVAAVAAAVRERIAPRPRSTAYIGGCCAVLALFAPLLHEAMFFVLSLPLLIAAFVLAIVALVRGQIAGGIVLLIALLPCLMFSCTMMTERERLLTEEGREQIRQESARHRAR